MNEILNVFLIIFAVVLLLLLVVAFVIRYKDVYDDLPVIIHRIEREKDNFNTDTALPSKVFDDEEVKKL